MREEKKEQYEPELELRAPEVQMRRMSEHCPQGYVSDTADFDWIFAMLSFA